MKENRAYFVAKQIMSVYNKSKKIEEEEINNFIQNYEVINEIVENMPRGMSNVGAAVGKCAIKYGNEKAISFLKTLKNKNFKGKDDPAYLFYMWINGVLGPKRKKNDISTYEITMYACKNYCMDKKIKSLRKSKDIFNWTSDWKVSD